ncbi:MAG: TetR/AcrR family transcriptional regulator [Deltaproteobacteria bacterium]|nr:TetR/AcrR family transcriptional regulator [Deltaproteobacteria bacterium]
MEQNETAVKILRAAQDCFFRHGFSKANLTLIAEYAGFSRVTIYKYFRSKEALFKEVAQAFLNERIAETEVMLLVEENLWKRLEYLIFSWIVSPFESIGDDWVAADLSHAHKLGNQDVEAAAQSALQGFLRRLVEEAQTNGQIDLARLGLTGEDLVEVLDVMLSGLFDRKVENIGREALKLIGFFRATLGSPREQP